jgi:hypothetical protein
MEEFKGLGRVTPAQKSREQIVAEYERTRPNEGVTIVRIDLSFGNIFMLALKFGIVWFVFGALGVLLARAIG